jgi:ADP-heptose:LPS heptosyltransferase
MINPKKVLIMGGGGIGDGLFLTPAIRAIRENFRNASISLFFRGNGSIIFKKNSSLNNIIEAPDEKFWIKDKVVECLRQEKYNLAIIFNMNPAYRYLAQKANIECIWSKTDINESPMPEFFTREYNRTKRNYISIARDRKSQHSTKIALDLIKETELSINIAELEMKISPEDIDFARYLLRSKGIDDSSLSVVFHPGTHLLNMPKIEQLIRRIKLILKGRPFKIYDPRLWPLKHYAKLGNLIIKKFNAKIIITGSKYEVGLAKKISNLSDFKPINLAGETNIWQLAAVLKKSDLFIGGDTGPLHLAMAMKTPVVGIYGHANLNRTGPWGPKEQFTVVKSNIECSPCQYTEREKKCTNAKCMKQITVENVFEAVESQLNKSNKFK